MQNLSLIRHRGKNPKTKHLKLKNSHKNYIGISDNDDVHLKTNMRRPKL